MRAFRIAYDGRPFHGFQRQPSVPTVENAIFDALARLGLFDDDARKPAGYAAAGRTDAGVSAVAQTVAFECPDWCSPRALNSELPGTVRAWAAADVADGFHATHDAVRRQYTYHLYAPKAETPEPPGELGRSGESEPSGKSTTSGKSETPSLDGSGVVDDDRVRPALAALCGEHDLHNLTPDETGTVRDLSATVTRDGDFLVLTVESDGFARELVRRLVSLVHAVGSGAAPPDTVDRVLAPEPIEDAEGVSPVPPAPPTPLVLTGVDYPGVAFEPDEVALSSTRDAFGEQVVSGRVSARVGREILAGFGSADR